MTALLVSIIGSLIGAAVLSTATGVANRGSPAPNLRMWTVAWVLQFWWLAGELAYSATDAWLVIGPATLLRLGSAAMLLRGTAEFVGAPTKPRVYVLFAAGAAWTIVAWLAGSPLAVVTGPATVLLGGALLCMGRSILRATDRRVGELVLGVTVIVLGLHHLDYLILRTHELGAVIGFLIQQALLLGTGIGLLALHYDRMRRAAKAGEHRFRSLVTSLDDLVFLLDRDGRHLQIEGRWRDDELIPREALLGRTATDVVGADEGRIHAEHHERAMREGPQKYEYTFPTRTGTRCVEISLSPVSDDSGSIVGTVGVSRDITHLKATQARLETELAERQILLNEIHHRSKNNMQVMSSMLALQAEHVPESRERQALLESAHRIETMAAVHEHLYGEDELAGIRMRPLIVEMLERAAQNFGAEGLSVSLDVRSEDLLLPLDAALPLAQIVQELATNAIKHAFRDVDRPQLSVHLRRNGSGHAELVVADNGVGIPDGVWPESGGVGEPAVTDQASGPLGLVLVSLLGRQIDATFTLAGRNGTTATISFPLPASAALASEALERRLDIDRV